MRQLLRYRQALNKLDLLVLDEPGYVPVSKAGAELLFDVIATAYERNSLIVTTNLPFEHWTEVLGSERPTGRLWIGSRTAATSWKPEAKATACRMIGQATGDVIGGISPRKDCVRTAGPAKRVAVPE
jgi:hypothetical protein